MSALRILALLWFIGTSPVGFAHEVEPLQMAKTQVIESLTKGGTPIVIFDLDDTLFDAGSRTLIILRELSQDVTARSYFPSETLRLELIQSPNQIAYELEDTFASLEIGSPEFLAYAHEFWKQRFFSNNYCFWDSPNPGAVSYVQDLYAEGARIVYLTGRDTPNMRAGTEASLELRGFPGEREGAVLITKPRFDYPDADFKKEAFEEISKWGDVVAGFENEPRNANLIKERFPESVVVFLNTRHSKKPDQVRPDILWVHHFLREEYLFF